MALGATALSGIAALAETVQDDLGRTVTLPRTPQRIVSLSPGATEMLFAAGAGDHVVATVQYADEPAAARKVPRIGDVVAIDMERFAALRADVAIAWPGGGNPAQIEQIGRMAVPIYNLQINTLAQLPASLRRVGKLAGTSAVAEPAARAFEARLSMLHKRYADTAHPSVLLEIWNHPIYTVGGIQLMSDALTACGARNVFADLRDMAPAVDIEAIIARDPDMIVAVSPPGMSAEWLADWRKFTGLRAVSKGKLIGFEDPAFVRMGPSILDATEGLCRAIEAARH